MNNAEDVANNPRIFTLLMEQRQKPKQIDISSSKFKQNINNSRDYSIGDVRMANFLSKSFKLSNRINVTTY